jgi:membrane protein
MGAEFTKVYAEYKGRHIKPAEYAVYVEHKEIEKEVKELPPQHEDLHE